MGNWKSRKIFILIAVIILVLVNISMPIIATPNETVIANQNKYYELNKTIDKTQGEIYKINTEVETLIETIKKNEEELKKVSIEIEKSKKDIEIEKENLKVQEEMLTNRLRELYKSGGQNNYIIMILASEGVTDFVSKIFIANKIVDLDKKVIVELKEKQEQIKKSLDELEEKINLITKTTEENKISLEGIEAKKLEQELLVAKLLQEKGKFDGEYLSVSERQLVEHQLKIVKESNSLEELNAVIGQLINIRDKQLKSPMIIGEINQNIIETIKRVEGLEKYMKENGTKIKEGTLSGNAIVSYAYQFLGRPYVIAGNGPDVFDCSGLTRYVYQNILGVDITRTTFTQIKQGESVPLSELQVGDLVFTYGLDHVGIYVGGGSYIHAPQPGDSVKVSPITSFTEGRRIIKN